MTACLNRWGFSRKHLLASAGVVFLAATNLGGAPALGQSAPTNSTSPNTPSPSAPAPKPGQSNVSVQPDTGGLTIVTPISPTQAADGFSQFLGVTSINTAARQMALNRVALPPGSAGPRNMHKDAESMVMVYQGTLTVRVGMQGDKKINVKSGEFLFVPGNVWHQWTNEGTEPAAIVEARKDANPGDNLIIIPTK